MASHSLLQSHQRQEATDFAEAVGRQLLRVDAILLGAIVIAIVMFGGLFILQSNPAAARDCRARAYGDATTGIATARDGLARTGGDHAACRMRAARLRAAG